MDSGHGFERDRIDDDDGAPPAIDAGADAPRDDAGVDDAMFDLGGDERRMHVRAYNHWVSLLKNRAYPSIEDLDPGNIADFGPNSVLLDFSQGIEDPRIAFIGRSLREECGLESSIARIADVPSRSLLSRLTDHYLQIIANRAPIGFEAEFIGQRGSTTMYRGILMPFSSDGGSIDFIYGVINWKEVVDSATQASLDAELDAAVRAAETVPAAPVWADGPSGGFEPHEAEPALSGSLGDRLAMARETAAAVRAADTRSRAALYRALGRAHDFALATAADPTGYAAILADAAITVQARAPMTGIVKLVFGAEYDKTRVTEFASVLQHASRHAVGAGSLGAFLEGFAGGIKAVVAAERQARKPAAKPSAAPPAPPFADRATLAQVAIDTGAAPGSMVVLLARVSDSGGLEIVGTVTDDAPLAERTLRAIG